MSKQKIIYCYANSLGYGKCYYEVMRLQRENEKLKFILDEIREQLKKIKPDLDFEPWSVYKVSGLKLFYLLHKLDKVIYEKS